MVSPGSWVLRFLQKGEKRAWDPSVHQSTFPRPDRETRSEESGERGGGGKEGHRKRERERSHVRMVETRE